MRRLAGVTLTLLLTYLWFAVSVVPVAHQLRQPPGQPAAQPSPQPLLPPVTDGGITITIAAEGFSPDVITVTLGDEVTWINGGTGRHGVSSEPPAAQGSTVFLPIIISNFSTHLGSAAPVLGSQKRKSAAAPWSSGPLDPGHIYRKAFNQLGTFQYYDLFHPENSGYVVVVAPNQPPTIQISSPTNGARLGPGQLQVTGTVSDDAGGLSVTVNGVAAQLTGSTFSALISLPSGSHSILAQVIDSQGLAATAAVVAHIDGQPPDIRIDAPKDHQSVYDLPSPISASYNDFGSQVDAAAVTVTLQQAGGAPLDITSNLTISKTGLSGQLPATLVAGSVYTLTVTAADQFGNQASQHANFYIADPVGAIQPPEATAQSGWVTGRVFDSSSCDPDLVSCQGLAGARITLAVVDAQAVAAVRQQRQNQLLSRLLDPDGFIPLEPLQDAAGTTPLSGTALTGPDGFFAFPADATARYWLRVEKAGFTYGQREVEIIRGRSTAADAIYLTPVDSAVTSCGTAGCSHINSDDTLRLQIPAGALTGTVDLRATWFSNVEFLPSGSLPPGTWETYAFDLSAGDEITFTVPVTVQISNQRGFAPGTLVPVGYWNQFTQEWEHVAVSTVDSSGDWLLFTTTHFSPFDANIPLTPPDFQVSVEDNQSEDPDNPDPSAKGPADKKDEPCSDGIDGCFVGLKSGVLQEWYALPPVEVLGQPEAPRMHYSAGRAYRTELIDARLVMNDLGTSSIGEYVIFELYIAGQKTEMHHIPVMTNTLGELGRFRYLWDGVDAQGQPMPPGIYTYTVKFTIPYLGEYCWALGNIFGADPVCTDPTGVFAMGSFTSEQSGSVILDGESGTAYGEGWALQGQQRLYEDERGQIVIMDGIRHDEFYFPQKDLLLAAPATRSAATAFAQISGDRSSAPSPADLTPVVDEPSPDLQPAGLEPLPVVDLAVPGSLPAYTESHLPDAPLTDVCGQLAVNTNWDLAGSPYRVTCDLNVATGVTLAIDPGVTVQFQPTTSLFVSGTLNAAGTLAQPVAFQAETGNAPGSWRQISFLPGSSGDLSHIIVEHGGNAPNSALLGAVTIASSQVAIRDSQFQRNQTALFISAAAPTITQTTFYSNSATYGGAIYLQNGAAPLLDGIQFQENRAEFSGGALYAQASSPRIVNSDLLSNTAIQDGGAVYLISGTLTIQGNLFSANIATSGDGGAIFMVNADEPSLVTGNSFLLNRADDGAGGGLFNNSYNNLIRDNQFIGNNASQGGAIAHNDLFRLTLSTVFSSNLFQENSARRGGGMIIKEGDPTLENNRFISNTVLYDGGALSLWSRLYAHHNLFWHNTAGWGGAVANNDGHAIPELTNNIIVGNIATNAGSGGAFNNLANERFPLGDYNLVWGNSTPEYFSALPGPHDISADPLFVDAPNFDFHLQPASPAIDAGSFQAWSGADFEGDLRPMGQAPDIGIDETVAFGVSIGDYSPSIGPGEITNYTLALFNPDTTSQPAVLTHTLPADAALIGFDHGVFSCTHDSSPLGGILVCDGTLPADSRRQLTVTIQVNDALLNPVYQHASVTATSNIQKAADQAAGWMEWCAVQVNSDPILSTLDEALQLSFNQDTVKVSGRCTPKETFVIDYDSIVQGGWNRDLTLRQPESYTTTLDGGYENPVLIINGDPIVDGFNFVHGVDQYDGVVQINGGSAALFQNNVVAYNVGMGISTNNDVATIQNNRIHHNIGGSDYGGTIRSSSTGNLIRNNWIHDNIGGADGGGIYVNRAGTIQNNLLQNNTAVGKGGGIYFSGYTGSPVTIEYNVIYGNHAAQGGGMALAATQFHVGSAFRNNIVISNTAATGGGIYQPAASDGVRFNNVWNNQNGDYEGVAPSVYDLSLDPLFEDPEAGDFHLAAGSPMIDAGDPFSSLIPDFEGDLRPIGLRVDIGADEYRSLSAVSKTSNDYSRLDFDLVTQRYIRVYPDQTQIFFDAQNRHDYTLDPDGKRTSYAYNTDGSVASLSITAPGESDPHWLWQFNYTAGRLDSIEDPAGRLTDVTVDARNQLTGVTFPNSSARAFFYDSRSLLTQQQDANGHLTDYGYDRHGRNRLILYPSRIIYDADSGVASNIRESRIITPSDTAYLLLNDRLPGSPDAFGTPLPTSAQILDEIAYGRGTFSGITDRWGYLISQSDGLGRTTATSRYSNGLPKKVTYPDGDCVEYRYNRNGSVTKETRMPESQCALDPGARNPSLLQVWRWEYEPRFNKISRATDPEGRQTSYRYDYELNTGEAGRLVEISYPLVDDGGGITVTPTRQFSYNSWGLLETETDPMGTVTRYEYTQGIADEAAGGANPRFKAGVLPVPGLLAKVIENDGGDNLTTNYLEYDAAGNPGKRVGPGGLDVTITLYDALNRIVQETDAAGVVTSYAYDGKGNQIEKIADPSGVNVVTSYSYDPYDQLIRQAVDDGTTLAVVSLLYDIGRMPALRLDARGGSTVYRYDQADQLVSMTDPEGYLTSYTYGRDGALAQEQDPSGAVTRYRYDNYNRKIEQIVDDGRLSLSTTYAYDLAGNLVSQTAADGTRTCYQYDSLNRKIAEILDCDGLRLQTSYLYDLNGNLLSQKDHRGVVTRHRYDSLNRQIEMILDDGGLAVAAQYSYNAAGSLETLTDNRGSQHIHQYDSLNRLVRLCRDISGLNQCRGYGYDALGNTAVITDANGIVTRHTFNGFAQRLQTVEDAGGLARTTRYSYDNAMNLLSITDDNGSSTHYRYNARDEQVEERYADGTAVAYIYDGRGLLQDTVDQEGVTLSNHFDGAGRLISRTLSSGGFQQFSYDPADRMVQAVDALAPLSSVVDIGFNAVNDVVAITETVGALSWTTSYDYGYTAGQYTVTYPSGVSRRYTLEPLGRAASVRTGTGQTIVNFSYQDNLGIDTLTYANGITDTVAYDPLDRPIRTSSTVADYRYGYDDAGSRTYRQRADLPGLPADLYRYNSLYQVTDALYGANALDPADVTAFDRLVSYTQDTLSNRLSVQDGGLVESYGPADSGRLSNPMNRYETAAGRQLAYDLKGDLVDDDLFSYGYDSLNRQIRAENSEIQASYRYNALNRRVAKQIASTAGSSTTYYIYDQAGQVLEERDSGDTLLARYTYAPGIDQPLTMERDGKTYTYHRDAQGSITEITDQAGQLVEQVAYDIYGDAAIRDGAGDLLPQSAVGNPYLYTGRRLDLETGNYYFRARVYHPDIGRFMQMDPAGYSDGMNLYANQFVVNGVDPSGMTAGAIGLFSTGGYMGIGGSFSLSAIYDFQNCCQDGVNKPGGMRTYGIKAVADIGLGLKAKLWIAGADVIDLGIKGPRLEGSTELTAKNRTCGGPVDSLSVCRTATVFAGATGSVSAFGVGIGASAGIKGYFKTCAVVTDGLLTVSGEFCGESNVILTYSLGRYSGILWQPQGYKVAGCSNIGSQTFRLP